MNSRRRLIYYLLINVFVSALVAGSIIYYYDRNHHVNCPTVLVTAATGSPGTSSINASLVGVIGAGTLKDERIIVQNNGSQELDLAGWYLTDSKGNTYTFPQLTLFPGVIVQLHTIAGQDSPSDLYWGRSSPAWTSGELVALYDSQNIARAFYRVP
ncbi:MAG TPA: lamin tail domain-containing protein [Anaerolineales bacterium]|nr:lamin tail domain-containing protein [Anaerolineales bacterium]